MVAPFLTLTARESVSSCGWTRATPLEVRDHHLKRSRPAIKAWTQPKPAGGPIGWLIYGFVWLLDQPYGTSRKEKDELGGVGQREGGVVIPRFLALASYFAFCLPYFGLGMATLALIVNWKRPGFSRTASLIAVVLSGFVTGAFVYLSAFAN